MLKITIRVLVCLACFIPIARAQQDVYGTHSAAMNVYSPAAGETNGVEHVEGVHRAVKPSLAAHVSHYVRTHKELLAADALVALSWAADAGSSVHCQRVSRPGAQCIETNSILGDHPSNAATWGYTSGISVGLITGMHLIWWGANRIDDPEARHLIWIVAAPTVISEAWNVRSNVNAAEFLQDTKTNTNLAKARARVMEK